MTNTFTPAPALGQDDATQVRSRDPLALLWARKGLIVLAIIAGIAAALLHDRALHAPLYRATATLALDPRSEAVVPFEPMLSDAPRDRAHVHTQAEFAQSRSLLFQVVNDLQLHRNPAFAPKGFLPNGLGFSQPPELTVQQAVARLDAALSVQVHRKAYVFALRVDTPDPALSTQIVNALAKAYIAQQQETKNTATSEAAAWLSQRAGELKAELHDKEAELRAQIAGSHAPTSVDLDVLRDRLRSAEDSLTATQEGIAALDARLSDLAGLRSISGFAALARTTGDPTLTRFAPAAATGDAAITQLFDTRLGILTDTARAELADLRQVAVPQENTVLRLTERLSAETNLSGNIRQAEREIEATRVLYQTLLERLKQTLVQRDLQRSDSRVLSFADAGVKMGAPVSLRATLGALLAGILACLFVIWQAKTQPRIERGRDLEHHLGIAVMGRLPYVPNDDLSTMLIAPQGTAPHPFIDAVRGVRSAVLLARAAEVPKIIATASALPDEGKTTLAIALAHDLSRLGKQVLVIEGDLRRCGLGPKLGLLPRSQSVTLAMTQPKETQAALQHHSAGFDVLLGNPHAPNSPDLFAKTDLGEALAMLGKDYDFILIDTPPVLLAPEALILARAADVTILNAAAGASRVADTARALRLLNDAGADVVGAVLSKDRTQPSSAARAYRTGYRPQRRALGTAVAPHRKLHKT